MLFNSLAFHKMAVLNQIYIKYHQINSFVPFYSRYLKTYKKLLFIMTFHTFFYYPSQSFFFPVVSETCTANSQNIWLNSNKPLVLYWRVFSCGSARKESGRPRFNPWVGKIPWRRERPPTLVFCPREFHGLYWRKLGWGGDHYNASDVSLGEL